MQWAKQKVEACHIERNQEIAIGCHRFEFILMFPQLPIKSLVLDKKLCGFVVKKQRIDISAFLGWG